MAYEDPRDVKRDEEDHKHKAQSREEQPRDEDWDNQSGGDFSYTDWASI